jgi:hypothetical protein
LKISGHQLQDILARKGVPLRKFAKHSLTSGDPNAGIDDCFGRESISLAALDAENVTGQVEGSDLPTTIREKLEGPNGTRLDLVDVVRGLGFAEDLGAPAIPEFVPEQSSGGQVVRSRISSRIRIHYVQHGTSDNTNKNCH